MNYLNYHWHYLGGIFRRHPTFSSLIIVIISIGTAASTSMMAVLHTLHADPMPGVSERIFHPQLKPSVAGYPPGGNLPDSLMWTDAMNLLQAPAGKRKAVILAGEVTVVPHNEGAPPYFAKAAYTQGTFFQMFQAHFAAGAAWDASADEQGAHVVVVSKALAEKTFGSSAVVGQTLRLGNTEFEIAGVLGDWAPRPRFYDLSDGAFAAAEDVFIPLQTSRALNMPPNFSPACWGSGMSELSNLEHASCTWVEFWVELDSSALRDSYLEFLKSYSLQQKSLGRFYEPPQVGLPNVAEWLSAKKIVPGSARLQAFIAYSFLLICILNASGLLLVMFMQRKRELGLRRTLGATKNQIFYQLLMEISGVAIVSAAFSSLLTWGMLFVIRSRPEAYYAYVVADREMIFIGLAVSLLTTLLATLLPAWQVSRGSPYSLLRS